ncbi:hypothetical protein SLEP1_g53066 [Rubroshorea leprosula]|uniref:Uncharacterized protein n=1 Tax=Rubroshorea leprosula TaxID=152421 RepID=A0AAV5MB18_9ROSI|nr:hypothetical protein SLEP1_g53066 [Rubroshorea leprosula]
MSVYPLAGNLVLMEDKDKDLLEKLIEGKINWKKAWSDHIKRWSPLDGAGASKKLVWLQVVKRWDEQLQGEDGTLKDADEALPENSAAVNGHIKADAWAVDSLNELIDSNLKLKSDVDGNEADSSIPSFMADKGASTVELATYGILNYWCILLPNSKIEHRSKTIQKELNRLKARNLYSLAKKKGLQMKGSEEQIVPLLVELMERDDAMGLLGASNKGLLCFGGGVKNCLLLPGYLSWLKVLFIGESEKA